MGRKLHNLTGKRFGTLVVAGLANRTPGGSALWRVVCDCGRVFNLSNCVLTDRQHRHYGACLDEQGRH